MFRKIKNEFLAMVIVVGVVMSIGCVMILSSSAAPSGVNMPTGDLEGWRQIFAEDFTRDAALGSWADDCSPDTILYTGSGGTPWRAYPKCYVDTINRNPYRSDAVLSVHDGTMDFWLHNVNGVPAGANPSPVLPGTTQYQTYGRYSYRIRLDTNSLSEYYMAWLLWPQNDSNWQCAESDFPEGFLNGTTFSAFAHYGCGGSQDIYSTGAIDMTQWHTFTQEWTPTSRSYYVDGRLIGTSTNQVFNSGERFQLQTETNGSGTHSGHLYVDWFTVYQYSPGTHASLPPPPPAPTPTPSPTPSPTPTPTPSPSPNHGTTPSPTAQPGSPVTNTTPVTTSIVQNGGPKLKVSPTTASQPSTSSGHPKPAAKPLWKQPAKLALLLFVLLHWL